MLGGNKAEQTAIFVSNFNKLFDCLNVSNMSIGRLKQDNFKSPYTSANDHRVKVFTCTYVPYS